MVRRGLDCEHNVLKLPAADFLLGIIGIVVHMLLLIGTVIKLMA